MNILLTSSKVPQSHPKLSISICSLIDGKDGLFLGKDKS